MQAGREKILLALDKAAAPGMGAIEDVAIGNRAGPDGVVDPAVLLDRRDPDPGLLRRLAARLEALGSVVVAFSGGLIGPPGTRWNASGRFDGMPAFFGCSDRDSHVPESRVMESAELFADMGADVTTRIYPGMGHLVNDDEIGWAQGLLDAAAG